MTSLGLLTDAFGALLLGLGGLLLLFASYGVLVLPDALTRQHAATKAVTLALALVCTGAIVAQGDVAWTVRLVAIAGFLIATLPVASHLLARAAVTESGQEETLQRAPLIGDDPMSVD